MACAWLFWLAYRKWAIRGRPIEHSSFHWHSINDNNIMNLSPPFRCCFLLSSLFVQTCSVHAHAITKSPLYILNNPKRGAPHKYPLPLNPPFCTFYPYIRTSSPFLPVFVIALGRQWLVDWLAWARARVRSFLFFICLFVCLPFLLCNHEYR